MKNKLFFPIFMAILMQTPIIMAEPVIFKVDPEIKLAEPEESISIRITLNSTDGTPMTAAQFNLLYSGSTILDVYEGNIFNRSGDLKTIFNDGILNNSGGKLINVWGLIIEPGKNVTGSGSMANINMVAHADGVLSLKNVIVANPESQAKDVNVSGGILCVSPRYDVNCVDHKINRTDLDIAKDNIGKKSEFACPEYENRCNVNKDLLIDILDLVLISHHVNT